VTIRLAISGLRGGLLCILLFSLASARPTAAQERSSSPPAAEGLKTTDPLNRTSPQSSVAGFLDSCRAHDYARACSYLDLRSLPHAARLKDGSRLAQGLEQILEGDTHFDVAELSADPNGSRGSGLPEDRERVDSFNDNGQAVDIELQRTRLRSGLWVWLFSPDTIGRIPRLMRITSESPVEKYLPDQLVNWTMAGTPLWRWIALALLAVGTAAFAWLLGPLALRCTDPVLKRVAPRMNWDSLRPFVGPLRLLLALALFRPGMEWIDPSPVVRLYLGRLLALLFFLALFWLFLGIVDVGLVRIRATLQARHRSLSYSALPLVGRVLKIVMLVLLVAAVLSEWGYNTTTIVASLGVGGIAIALAAQKTIENFFGGVSVVADRPVAVGDFCKFGDRVGTVEDIGLRSTRIRTPDRTLVSVPNGQFSTMTIENFSKRDKMLFHFMLNLRRDTRPDQVRNLLESIGTIFEQHKKVDAGAAPVHFVGVGTYSLDLEITVYILTANDDEFAKTRQELLLAILDAVEIAGTALALPTQASIEYSRIDPARPNAAAQPDERNEPVLSSRR
jgi:MscS family membrane protein